MLFGSRMLNKEEVNTTNLNVNIEKVRVTQIWVGLLMNF